MAFSNIHDNDRMLIVISAPTTDNEYSADVYEDIIAFDIAYAKAVMGNDNLIVLRYQGIGKTEKRTS